MSQSPLFEIDREMQMLFPNIPFYPEIGSIQNRARLDEVFSQYRPAVVYHAAAYKHVPLMEQHVFEAIENNVFFVTANRTGHEPWTALTRTFAGRATSSA